MTLALVLALSQPTSNFDQWVTRIKPDAKELAWQNIPWRRDYWEGVQEAKRLGRPILLWTMNGHPLGCT